jgi:hypothetical protein
MDGGRVHVESTELAANQMTCLECHGEAHLTAAQRTLAGATTPTDGEDEMRPRREALCASWPSK